MLQKIPVPNTELFVWALIPHYMTEQGLVSHFGEEDTLYNQELADVFAELGIHWKWQPITFENMYVVIEEVAATSSEYIPVVLNYCYGDEDPKYPGTNVYKLLEAKGIPSAGADAASIEFCTSKINMKRAFIEANILTAPYEVVADINNIWGICERLGTPLIVKPAMSYGSKGISSTSVVFNDEQVTAQIQRLLQGEDGSLLQGKNAMQFPPDSIFVEQFINGPEFTVFLIGSCHQPDSIKIYPPVERVFDSNLPEIERFRTYDIAWNKYVQETSVDHQEPLLSFKLVSSELNDRLCSLAKNAYCTVGSSGFGRVDIRMDKVSQELFVLEVNPTCDITADQRSSVGNILYLSATSFAQLMSEIITEALVRRSTKTLLESKLRFYRSPYAKLG